MQSLLTPLILVIALMTAAVAAEPQLDGAGTLPCGRWTFVRRDRTGVGYEQWVLGFLSGISYAGEAAGDNPVNGVDGETVWAWIDTYCQAHPLETIATASAAFVRARPH